MKSILSNSLFVFFLLAAFSSCDTLIGKKKDKQVDEIFEQGRIDPKLYPTNAGYVPILPFWQGFNHPKDVFVGFDEMVYVVDDNGVHILDLAGVEHRLIAMQGATDVIQDRRIHTYICGRILKDITGDNIPENLPAVYHLSNASSSNGPIFIDTLIYPFCDASRNTSGFRGVADEQVEFTGVAVMADNKIYVSRKGPTNNLTTVAIPDNSILLFDKNGINVAFCNGLNPIFSSIKSTLDISAIATAQVPPQQYNDAPNSFYISQSSSSAEYKVLSIKELNDPDAGTSYGGDPTLLNFDYAKASRFLYQSYRFKQPADVFVAPDANKYIFIVDEGTDSLYQFTPKGYEGVNPTANSGITKQIIASFGGSGNGPFQFNQPSGVCYFKKRVYVADKGNNRICRYMLSTDLEQ